MWSTSTHTCNAVGTSRNYLFKTNLSAYTHFQVLSSQQHCDHWPEFSHTRSTKVVNHPWLPSNGSGKVEMVPSRLLAQGNVWFESTVYGTTKSYRRYKPTKSVYQVTWTGGHAPLFYPAPSFWQCPCHCDTKRKGKGNKLIKKDMNLER